MSRPWKGTARLEALFMRIKKKNVARLASLSALGAGALGVAAGTAKAGLIYYSPIPSGTVVGPTSGHWLATVTLTGPAATGSNNHFRVTMPTHQGSGSRGTWRAYIHGYGVPFMRSGGFLGIVGSGQKWSGVGSLADRLPIASRGFRKYYNHYHQYPGSNYHPHRWVSGTKTDSGTSGGHFTGPSWTGGCRRGGARRALP
jgi:hypothetical protein